MATNRSSSATTRQRTRNREYREWVFQDDDTELGRIKALARMEFTDNVGGYEITPYEKAALFTAEQQSQLLDIVVPTWKMKYGWAVLAPFVEHGLGSFTILAASDPAEVSRLTGITYGNAIVIKTKAAERA